MLKLELKSTAINEYIFFSDIPDEFSTVSSISNFDLKNVRTTFITGLSRKSTPFVAPD